MDLPTIEPQKLAKGIITNIFDIVSTSVSYLFVSSTRAGEKNATALAFKMVTKVF